MAQANAMEKEMEFSPVESYFTRPMALDPGAPCEPSAFWESSKHLPETPEISPTPLISALLVKKGGDFPEFWKKPSTFPATMEVIYEAIRKKSKNW